MMAPSMASKPLLPILMPLQISLQSRLITKMSLTARLHIGIISSTLALEAVAAVVLSRIDRIRLFNILQRHAAVGVPDDVAMHDPGARVVGLEADDCPAALGSAACAGDAEQQGSVAADGVGEVEGGGVGGGEDAFALAEDGEVVAVEMDRVGGLEIVLDHEVDPVAGGAVEDYGVGVDRAIETRRKAGWQCS